MSISVKPLEEMIRNIIASLQAGTPGGRPIYALVLGSGFSYPIVPTPTQMLRSDIAWWRFCNDRRVDGLFRSRVDAAAMGFTADCISMFERDFWQTIHASCAGDERRRFPLDVDGLPDLTVPENVGRAYDAAMSYGLLNDRMRWQYLRDAIVRAGRKVNSAHIFLAGVLEVQEAWDWGAPFCRTIFTTNFDPLLQRSLQLVNKLYYMTDRPEVLEAPDDDQSDAIHLIYTHGSVHRYGLLNTGDQIEKARKQNAARLVGYLQRHGVIVMGYSGWRDTTVEALLSCSSFDSNLYWCDVHPADQVEACLRPEVLELLRESGRNAYYVHIPSADEAMRQLHRALKLGDVPKFILEPISTLIEQLKSIDVPTEPAGPSGTVTQALSGSDMATLLAGTLQGLEVARLAFDDPKIVRVSSPQAEHEVVRALTARLMRDALAAVSDGKPEQAIALWTSVIEAEEVPAADRARALLNRGITHSMSGKVSEAIQDYTAVINMAGAPSDEKAQALVNGGVTHDKAGRKAEAIEAFTAVVGMMDAPVEQKAKALVNRGAAYAEAGRVAAAIEDLAAAIGMPDALAEDKLRAFHGRGIIHGRAGRSAEAIEDLTAAIEMPDASPEDKARALFCRGITYGNAGRRKEEIEDYTVVIEMTGISAALRADALVNRGVAYFHSNGTETAITADYTAVIGMANASAEQKASALINRGSLYYTIGNRKEAIADYTMVIEMRDATGAQKVQALIKRIGTARNFTLEATLPLVRLLEGDVAGALEEYEKLLIDTPSAAVLRSAIHDLQVQIVNRPHLPGAETALELLTSIQTRVQIDPHKRLGRKRRV